MGGTPPKALAKAASHHSLFFKIQPKPSMNVGVETTVNSAVALRRSRPEGTPETVMAYAQMSKRAWQN